MYLYINLSVDEMKRLVKYSWLFIGIGILSSCSNYKYMSENDVYVTAPSIMDIGGDESDLTSFNAFRSRENSNIQSQFIGNNMRVMPFGMGMTLSNQPMAFHGMGMYDPFYRPGFSNFGYHNFYSPYYSDFYGYNTYGSFYNPYHYNPYYYNPYYYGSGFYGGGYYGGNSGTNVSSNNSTFYGKRSSLSSSSSRSSSYPSTLESTGKTGMITAPTTTSNATVRRVENLTESTGHEYADVRGRGGINSVQTDRSPVQRGNRATSSSINRTTTTSSGVAKTNTRTQIYTPNSSLRRSNSTSVNPSSNTRRPTVNSSPSNRRINNNFGTPSPPRNSISTPSMNRGRMSSGSSISKGSSRGGSPSRSVGTKGSSMRR